MLVLQRGLQESIAIGDDIVITIVRIRPNAVRLAIQAPRNLNIVRTELQQHNKQPESKDSNGASQSIDTAQDASVFSDSGL